MHAAYGYQPHPDLFDLGYPVIPVSSSQVLAVLGLPAATTWLPGDMVAELQRLGPGHPFTVPAPLFRKITDEDIAAWTDLFGGSEEVTPA
jgi:methionyl-tRNA synthetase